MCYLFSNLDLKLKRFLYISALFVFSGHAYAGELKPFTSDGCSAFPDGTLQQNKLWLECCTAHDFSYWKGGTYEERLNADTQLRECVIRVGEPEVAMLMLAGVRVGGTPYLPTAFRWGYGWDYPRFYGLLSQNEQVLVEKARILLDDKYDKF